MTDRNLSERRMTEAGRGHVAMLLFSAAVAGSFSLGVRTANLIDPGVISAARLAIAAGILCALALAGPGLPRRTFAAGWRYLIVGGLFAFYFVLMFEGLKTASAVAASAVFTLTPVMSALFGWWMMRQRTTPRMAAALAIGAAGALWVIFRGDLAAMARLEFGRGEAIYLIGCAAHALYTPMVRWLNRGEGPLPFAFGTLAAAAVLLIVWDFRAIIGTDWAGLPGIVWFTLIYIAVFATAGSTVLLQFAALRLPAAKVMAYTYLIPSWVIVIEAALGQGGPGVIVLPGILVTIVALALLLKD